MVCRHASQDEVASELPTPDNHENVNFLLDVSSIRIFHAISDISNRSVVKDYDRNWKAYSKFPTNLYVIFKSIKSRSSYRYELR